jgi:hypothetical protein
MHFDRLIFFLFDSICKNTIFIFIMRRPLLFNRCLPKIIYSLKFSICIYGDFIFFEFTIFLWNILIYIYIYYKCIKRKKKKKNRKKQN